MNPVKPTFKSEIIPIIILIIVGIVTFVTYPMLPAQVASHWNFAGQVDGWTSKAFHAIFFPCLLLGVYLLLLFVPAADPRRERYTEFRGAYGIFRHMILIVLTIIYLAATFYNLGYPISVGKVVPWVIGIMMLVLGNYMSKIKFNWFVGVRTPWTLSSEAVWNKTHRVGGYLFMIFGVLIIIAPYLPNFWNALALFGGVVMLLVGTFLYSYIEYRKEKKLK